MSIPPVAVGFLGQDCHYKLVVVQIPHDTVLEPIRPVGDRTQERCMRGGNSAPAPQRGHVTVKLL